MNIPAPWSTILAIIGYIGGAAESVVGLVNVGNWSGAEQAIITAIGGVLTIVTHYHVTKKAVAQPPTIKGG